MLGGVGWPAIPTRILLCDALSSPGGACRWKKPHKAGAFYRWMEQAAWQKDTRNRLRKLTGRMRNVKASAALNAWYSYCKDLKLNGYADSIDVMKVRK